MTARLRFIDRRPAPADFRAEVLDGLSGPHKRLPPKFFYDQRGSLLFEAICETPEYYPTRTEIGILTDSIEEIAAAIGEDCLLIEPGSGSCRKVRLLLEHLRPAAYLPMDISSEHLAGAARDLADEHPWLEITGVCMDYGQGLADFDLSGFHDGLKRVVFFPGSTIGNFEPREAAAFLQEVAALTGPGGGLLIGVDLKKDPEVLHRAYNDADGNTREFNLNLLHRINGELDGSFDPEHFHHYAFYQTRAGRIEMHLVSRKTQTVQIGDENLAFTEGETIHTENSYKYTVDEFRALAETAGFRAAGCWCDEARWFSVQYYELAN